MHALASTGPLPPGAPTIVLVHGVLVSGRYLRPLARNLAARARVYVPDLPGYGHSEPPADDDLDVPALAGALLTWMDRVGLERPDLFGNSFGCQVIAELAMRHPDRVRRLVLQGPTMDPHARTLVRQGPRFLTTCLFERYSEGLVLARDLVDIGPRRAPVLLRHGLCDPIERKLPRIAAPTLVVRGGHDLIVPRRWAAEAARLLPNGRIVELPGAAHTINYSQPERLANTIWPFLAGDAPDTRDRMIS